MSKYQFNDCGVCTNYDVAVEYTEDKSYLLVKVAQLDNGTFVCGTNWQVTHDGQFGGCSEPCSITDKQYPTKEDATIAALQGWMQSKSHGGYVAHLAKKAMIKYQNETLQLSLF